MLRRAAYIAACLGLACLAAGCTVITVAGTAVSVTAGAVGLAADAAIGTARIVGKGVGKAADALMDDEPDNSGIQVQYRESNAAVTTPVAPAGSSCMATALPELSN